jgi:polygalacturonase
MYFLFDLLALKGRKFYCLLWLALWPLAGWAQGPAATYVPVRQLGATGQRSQDATAIIQKGIDQLWRAGGGVLYFGPGKYTTATLVLKDNITLYLEAGAEILASRKPEDYAAAKALAGATANTPALFYAKGAFMPKGPATSALPAWAR